MTKAKLHPTLLGLSGAMGDMVFRQRNGKTTVAIKPDMSNLEPSEAQIEHRERFRDAVAYGKTVMADSDMRELYEEVARERDVPVFAVTVADFLNPPTIKDIDASTYNGQENDQIKIKTADDFGVLSVQVTLTNENGNQPIENGTAIETGPNSGLWIYTASEQVASGTSVHINVVATDRPGGVAVSNNLKMIE